MKNIRIFYLKNCHFLVVKFSVYFNRHVFVMCQHAINCNDYKLYVKTLCQEVGTKLLNALNICLPQGCWMSSPVRLSGIRPISTGRTVHKR